MFTCILPLNSSHTISVFTFSNVLCTLGTSPVLFELCGLKCWLNDSCLFVPLNKTNNICYAFYYYPAPSNTLHKCSSFYQGKCVTIKITLLKICRIESPHAARLSVIHIIRLSIKNTKTEINAEDLKKTYYTPPSHEHTPITKTSHD